MRTDVLKKSDEKVLVHLKDAKISLVNALRRIIISEIPCFAVDEVNFIENTSVMYNEYVANRIGLIPLSYEETLGEDAKIIFTLEAEGPCTVYSKSLQSTDPKIQVFNEGIPIMKLGEGQRLKLEATAVKGVAKQHAKFQCALASYGYYPDSKKVGKEDVENLLRPEALEGGKEPLKFKENEFVFFVESFNNVSAWEQLLKGLEILKEKCSKIKKEL